MSVDQSVLTKYFHSFRISDNRVEFSDCHSITGPELVQQSVEAVRVIRDRLRTAQSRQKSYADKRRKPLEFQVADHVFLKVSPMRGLSRFGKKGKLSPRFVGPFEILEKIGTLAYRLALPPNLSQIHNVFHVSMLRKYEPDPGHILDHEVIEMDDRVLICVPNAPIGSRARTNFRQDLISIDRIYSQKS